MGRIPAEISLLATRQHGLITRAQLLGAGVSARTATRWVESARLIRIHAGVYAVGHRNPHPVAVTMAAVLACGPGAAAGQASAGALWGPLPFPPLPEVVAPRQKRRPGIITHRSRTLSPAVIRRQYGVPVTSVARTIIDIAPRLRDEDLVRFIDEVRHRALLGPHDLADLAGAHRRIGRLVDPAGNPTRSRFEQRFLALCRRHRLPAPQTNRRILPGIEADIVFLPERVIVELDSWRDHRSHARFVADRARDRRTAAAGFVTLRYPWEAVTPARATATAQEVMSILLTR